MTGIAHAIIGAGAGSLCKKPQIAFIAGIATHFLADWLPHKDIAPRIDVIISCALLMSLLLWKGIKSVEFWGAFGGVSPDFEHALKYLNLITERQEIFPTHVSALGLHGREISSYTSQIAIAALFGLLVIAKHMRERQTTISS